MTFPSELFANKTFSEFKFIISIASLKSGTDI